MKNHEQNREMTLKVLSGIGLIVVLIAAGWAGAQVIKYTPNALSNVASALSAYLSGDEGEKFIGPEMPDEETTEEETGEETGGNEPIVNSSPQGPVQGPTQTTTVVVPQVPVSNPNGISDLQITYLDLGVVDTDGNFTPKDPVTDNDRVAIKFVVENIGDKETGEWEFYAELPGRRTVKYDSPAQQSLFPTERIEFVIGFDRADKGNTEPYEITVDPDNDITERNEQNNRIQGTIQILD